MLSSKQFTKSLAFFKAIHKITCFSQSNSENHLLFQSILRNHLLFSKQFTKSLAFFKAIHKITCFFQSYSQKHLLFPKQFTKSVALILRKASTEVKRKEKVRWCPTVDEVYLKIHKNIRHQGTSLRHWSSPALNKSFAFFKAIHKITCFFKAITKFLAFFQSSLQTHLFLKQFTRSLVFWVIYNISCF